MNDALPLTEAEFGEQMRLSRQRQRRCTTLSPVLVTDDAANETRRIIYMLAESRPDLASCLALALAGLDTGLAKQTANRAQLRKEAVIWLFENVYKPAGASMKRTAAEQMHADGKRLKMTEAYPGQKERMLKRIREINGGDMPSRETLRKDIP
ncbi:hypothetical protein ACFFP0_31685 [Rhizobium puerariae]|uniref:Chromosome partitioning protein ParB n=1 Tax=Rhizobium puerariae TaxID=1585791 RepID=A0ABV6AVT2_9HYPH